MKHLLKINGLPSFAQFSSFDIIKLGGGGIKAQISPL